MKHDDPAAGRSGGGSGGGDELGEHSGSDGEEVQGRRRGAREQLRELRDGGVGGSIPKTPARSCAFFGQMVTQEKCMTFMVTA